MRGFFIFIVLFVAVLAVAVGALAVGSIGQSNEQRAALAEIDKAKAAQELAKAEAEAQRAALLAEEVSRSRMNSAAWSTFTNRLAEWSTAFIFALWLSVAVCVVGSSVAAIRFLNYRATMAAYYPKNGALPALAYSKGGNLLVVDVARQLGTVQMDEGSGAVMQRDISEQTAADVAKHSITGATIAAVATKQTGAEILESVSGAVSSSFAALTQQPQAQQPAMMRMTTQAQPAIRFIKTQTAEQRNSELAALDSADMRAFIEQGADIGFTRAVWLGRELPTGRRCTKSRWQWMRQALTDARLLDDDGHLIGSVAEALQALQIETDNQQAEESEE